MSDFESAFDTSSRKTDDSDGFGVATPHRAKRINLGTPANYYFKYMNSGKKNTDISFSNNATDEGENTGTISIPGLKLSGTPSKGETSFFSMAGSSTGSEASDDMLNKSTLSDTTELTASNFVLVTTSKQNMIRKNRDSFSRQNDKENDLNRKDRALENKSDPRVGGHSVSVKKQVETADFKDQDGGIAETKCDDTEEIQTAYPNALVRSASPSLRSRISSSPASLRKFHENLKNSRMKRQIQREVDTKRRLSIEGTTNTLDSMNAQLEALTSDRLFPRERLPPQFTQLSPSRKSASNGNSHQASPAGYTTDATATIEMGDLDDLLGMKDSEKFGKTSDPLSNHSFAQDEIENVTSPHSVVRKEQTSTPLPAMNKTEEAENAFISDVDSSSAKNSKSKIDAKENQEEGSAIKSTSFTQDTEPEYASPTSTPKSNSRKRGMTPTKLSSTPRRIVNPDSIFSPARNTRSATKKRKLAEENKDVSPTDHIVRSKQSSKVGTRLFQIDMLSENDTSMDSESSDMPVEVPRGRKGKDMSSSKDDDTASLGDIINLFNIGRAADESFESSISHTSEKKHRDSEGQDTASIGDINDVLNADVSYNHDSPNQKTFNTSQIRIHDHSEVSQKMTLDKNSTTLSSEDSKNIKLTDTENSDDFHSLDVPKEGIDFQPDESHDNIFDLEDSASPEKDNSASTLDSTQREKSPGLRKASSQQNLILRALDGSQSTTKIIPKSPIRLTPNRHQKPTPTKLTPIPRRVMNPKNPNSPARNTRSSSKKYKLHDDSKVGTNEFEGNFASSLDQNGKVEVGKVLFSSNRRQSVGVKRISNIMKGSQSPTQNNQRPPVGILSSKKTNCPRRSVAFGSPEAAEYNVGSPSVSLTPMPKGRAKALFTLPLPNLRPDDKTNAGQEKMVANDDTSVGLGMNLLVDKITVEEMNDSPELSPIMKNKTDGYAYQSSSGFIVPNGIAHHKENNPGLEDGRDASFSGSPSEMRDSSIELTDSESIVSINSKCNKYTSDIVVPFHAQRLDFSVTSDTSEINDSEVEKKFGQKIESTAELEGNMLSFLGDAYGKNEEEKEEKNRSNGMNISGDTTEESEQFAANLKIKIAKSGVEGDKTVELEGNMLSLLEATNDNQKREENNTSKVMENSGVTEKFTGGIDSIIITKTGNQGDKTIELEENIFSLLKATGRDDDKKRNETSDKMGFAGVSEKFSGDINGVIPKTSNEGDKTVELEGNMFSLLEATSGVENEKENDINNEMDITEDSSFLALKDITTESIQVPRDAKTDIEGEKTVELEGNMFSLLEATSSGEDNKENDINDRIDITRELSSSTLKNNTTESVQFIGNLDNMIVTKTGVGVDKTRELEGDMLSLLEAANDGKNEEKNDSNHKMDITEVSLSLIETNNTTESEQFTGNLGINVVNVKHSQQRSTGGKLTTSCVDTEVEALISSDISLLQGKSEKDKNLVVSSSKFKPVAHGFLEDAGERRKRRKSLSSNSFVVHQVDEVQSLVDDITMKHESLVYDKSVSFSDTAEFITTLSTDPAPMTEHKPLDVSSFTSMLLEGLEIKEKDGDMLSNSFSRFAKTDSSVDRIVFERWGQFVDAVCGEVERRIDLEGTAVSSLAEIVDDDPRFYTMLQERLQSSQHGGKIKKSMNSLVQAGQTLIEYDWNSWLATVLESFHGPLADTQQIYANDATKLEETLRHIKKFQTDILLMNDLETKLAREKSILRQREAATKVEKEIESIESQLSSTKSMLIQLEEEETNLLKSTRDQQELIHNAKLYDNLRVKAESSQKNFVSLNGLHSWSMKTRSDNDLEFITTGSCQQTHLKLMYKGAVSGKANKIVSSKVDPSDAKSNSLHVYQEPLSGFLDTSTKQFIETAQQSCANGPVRICDHLQKYTWLAGRLDLIAKEFQVVQRRYNGILHRKSGDSFSFSVDFESEHTMVVANFRIESPYYPSFPIEVRLDLISGEQDLEVIKKSLLKNANPGFGSLSRACDIIQSIVRGQKKI